VIASSLPEEWRYADDKGQAASRGYGLLPRRVYLRAAAKGHYLSAARDGTMTSTLPTQGTHTLRTPHTLDRTRPPTRHDTHRAGLRRGVGRRV
jgi:hypothetical protein